jgi:DNA-binding IclR family transcriptional regulator
MKARPDWMSNTDVLILLALDSSDLITVLSPSIIAFNLGMSREHASRRLAELTERGYVEKVEKGKYSLSQTGAEFLSEVPDPE